MTTIKMAFNYLNINKTYKVPSIMEEEDTLILVARQKSFPSQVCAECILGTACRHHFIIKDGNPYLTCKTWQSKMAIIGELHWAFK